MAKIHYANRCLVKFVAQFHELYSETNTSFNVPLLLQLGERVRIIGCLQKQSAFVYEDGCCFLLRSFYSKCTDADNEKTIELKEICCHSLMLLKHANFRQMVSSPPDV